MSSTLKANTSQSCKMLSVRNTGQAAQYVGLYFVNTFYDVDPAVFYHNATMDVCNTKKISTNCSEKCMTPRKED